MRWAPCTSYPSHPRPAGRKPEHPALPLLGLALFVALGFEFVNGFHDTANAVATVIYTRSLGPAGRSRGRASATSGGVLGGTAVAFGIVNLLPVDLWCPVDRGAGLAMVMALLLARSLEPRHVVPGDPGVQLAHPDRLDPGRGAGEPALRGAADRRGVELGQGRRGRASLLISPLIGFACAAALLLVLKRTVERPPSCTSPPGRPATAAAWVRGTLLATCTGVSLAHGSNDGQKGIGLIMLILIGTFQPPMR